MKRISSLFLAMAYLFFVFSSLLYGGKEKERREPEEKPFLSQVKRPLKSSSIASEVAEKGERESGNQLKRAKRENTEVSQNKNSSFSGPRLPLEIINLILWYVSADGSATSSLLVSKNFHDLLQENNKKRVKAYLYLDLPIQNRIGKTEAELYHLHRVRLKASLTDVYEIPTTLENVYSSPYLEDKGSLIPELLRDVYPFNKKVQYFMSVKGNSHALLSQICLESLNILKSLIEDKIWLVLANQGFSQTEQDSIKQDLIPQLRDIVLLHYEKLSHHKNMVHQLQNNEEKWFPAFKGIFLEPCIETIENISRPFSSEEEKFFLNKGLILDELINRNNELATHMKYQEVPENDLNTQHHFIEAYAERGIPYFIKRKVKSLVKGNFGYEQNVQAARYFLEKLIEQGNQFAKSFKLNNLIEEEEPRVYAQDPEFARNLNENWVEKGDQEALERKIKGLAWGEFGYIQDLSQALELIEKKRSQDETHKIMRCEVEIYLDLMSQKEHNPKNLILTQHIEKAGLREKIQDYTYIHFLIDQLIDQKDEWALNLKIEGLKTGKYGYTRDLKGLRPFIEKEADACNRGAMRKKLVGLYLGVHGYTQDLPALASYISSLHAQGFREASYLKAIGLKFGVFGFKEQLLEARKFILQHRIAF